MRDAIDDDVVSVLVVNRRVTDADVFRNDPRIASVDLGDQGIGKRSFLPDQEAYASRCGIRGHRGCSGVGRVKTGPDSSDRPTRVQSLPKP